MEERLQRISINDNRLFSYNAEVINACFNGSFPVGYWFQKATFETHDGCYAWFPKEAIMRNGKWVSGAETANWKNQFHNNGEVIESWLYPDEKPSASQERSKLEDNSVPLYCFWMDSSKTGYKYVGTYLCDFYSSTPERRIYRRIGTEIDLTKWYIRDDYEYWQDDIREKGHDAYRQLYIGRSFKKQLELIDKFNRKLNSIRIKENIIENNRQVLLAKKKLKLLNDIEKFKQTFLSAIRDFINSEFSLSIDISDLWPETVSEETNLKFYFDVLSFDPKKYRMNLQKTSHLNIIQDSPIEKHLCGCLLYALYDEFYLFSLTETETDFYLDKLDIKHEKDADLIEKHCLLYFWKQCNRQTLFKLSPYEFYEFLKFTFGAIVTEKPIKKISREIIVLNEIEEEKQNQELYQNDSDFFPASFEYNKKPIEKPKSSDNRTIKVVPRDPKKKANALAKAEFRCELNHDHKSFISRATKKPYMETHHLVPLEYWEEFDGYLDVEENIVSLCSNCHNEIHYGENAENLITKLFEERKKLLKAANINVSLDDLLKMYH